MSRMFEVKGDGSQGEFVVVIDLDKVSLVRVEKEPGHSFPRIAVRFVDGHEHHDAVPEQYAHHFLDAYRAYLKGRDG